MRVDLLTSINLGRSHRHAQRLTSLVVLDPFKLAIHINLPIT